MRWTRRSKGECSAAYGQVVWFWRRVCWRKAPGKLASRGATVTTSSLHREEHEVSRKAIAQGMSVCSPLTCMLVCNFLAQASTRDRGCSAHPAFPAPSLFKRGAMNWQSSGKPCREIASPYSLTTSSLRTQGPIRRVGNCESRMVDGFCFDNNVLWLWVPAFAGTTPE
jgi:hypothetical protein